MKLERINTGKISGIIRRAMRDFPEITGAYLFGSALGYFRPDSDIDIALFVDPELGLDEYARNMLEGKIALRLNPINNHIFDLTVVNPENTIFVFRIIKEGLLLYTGDEDKLYDIVEKVSRDYDEKGFRHRLAMQEILGEDVKNDY
ncbi:MAG: nucleotidyltransferase domain-containing protein [Bacillota bacterium]